MVEFLSNSSWQGIGVITSIFFSIFGIVFTVKSKSKFFKKNSSSSSQTQKNTTSALEGQKVTLQGTIRDKIFPGPPNYESIDNGDKPQVYWILYTNNSVELVGRSFENNKPFDLGNSCSFQLVLDSKFYENKKGILGKNATVTGTIFIGHSGHHKTKALIDVESIKIN